MNTSSELWLFGSAARGDIDSRSDIDVLVAGALRPEALRRLPYRRSQLSVVRYSWDELAHMAGYGSLFLHHVRLEGRALLHDGPSRLAGLLRALPPYHRAERELASFRVVLDDVEDSLLGEHSASFELSVIATTLRHSCILGCYALGRPTFGRRSAFEVFLPHAGFDDFVDETQRLYDFRLFEDERGPAPFVATTEHVLTWLPRTRMVIEAVAEVLHDR